MNWIKFADYIKRQEIINLPQELSKLKFKQVLGGDIHSAYKLILNKHNLFLKINKSSCLPLLETEYFNLNKLNSLSDIRLPQAYGVGVFENYSWMLMEYLYLNNLGNDFKRGQDLARLHKNLNPDMKFGWYQHNYIGRTIQYNTWSDNWIDFYIESRIKPQVKLAKDSLGSELLDMCNNLIAIIPNLFKNYNPVPSLLHGDLWSGNSSFLENGQAVFYDLASYYGDRETDIAMSELFGGFSTSFYQGYNTIYPLDSGYTKRKYLYQLYHILNHLNLFGKSYLNQVRIILQNLELKI